jgi:hypothetical protein
MLIYMQYTAKYRPRSVSTYAKGEKETDRVNENGGRGEREIEQEAKNTILLYLALRGRSNFPNRQ